MELVKNAYDADASFVEIEFSYIKGTSLEENKLKIVVTDNGHGMSFDTVVNKWMVPATNDKLKRKKSLIKKRIMQGRKGIGRYASAILGSQLNLKTIDLCGNETVAKIDWEEFEKERFLTDVDILLQEKKTEKIPEIIDSLLLGNPSLTLEETLQRIQEESLMIEIGKQVSSGTRLEIIGDYLKLSEWTDKRIEDMIKDLKKLLSPLKKNENDFKEKFKIKVNFTEFPSEKYQGCEIEVAPYPLVEMYDYRVFGRVDGEGYADLCYENNVLSSLVKEPIERFKVFLPNEEKYCGPIEFDLRVFDKDAESISNLIQKGEGLKDLDTGKYLGKLEAKKLIRDISGVGIYRGDFRIRPYGDKGYDWLELDKKRVQDPSKKVGNDQIVGFINIASEEVSFLEEKSARDGIKENGYYEGLCSIAKRVLSELENRRYIFRRKAGKGRKQTPLKKQLDDLFDFSTLSNKIESKLQTLQVEDKDILEFKEILTRTKEEKTNILEEIQETIAIYQGQATLGKIIMVLQHEGRRPIGYIKNQVPVLDLWIKQLQDSGCSDDDLLEKLADRLQSSKKQMEILSNLFNKIDPLSVKKRGSKKRFSVNKVIDSVLSLFEKEFEINNIDVKLTYSESAELFGWESDLTVALTNIIENSIYWLNMSKSEDKSIDINITRDEESLIIDVIDNGPGIDKSLIEDNLIFEPDFTLKQDGTGLGLAISGEATVRNGGQLKALNNSNGAYFRLEFKE
ncbi:ATP-binding protein (plasmid) [Bacillus sp. H8-1]|nr:ATP-binding protein [Bacillus sp. H8-1]